MTRSSKLAALDTFPEDDDDSSDSSNKSDYLENQKRKQSHAWALMLDASLGVKPSSPPFFHTYVGYVWKLHLHWQKTFSYRFDVLMQDWRYKYMLLIGSIAFISLVLTGLLKIMISIDCNNYEPPVDIDDDGSVEMYNDPSYTIIGGDVYCNRDTDFATLAWIGYAMVMDVASHLSTPQDMTYTRVVAISGTFFGILMFSIITGVMVDKVSRFLLAVDQGMSAVAERDHHLIVGWTSKGPFLLDELCRSMESEGGGTIAILSPMSKMALQRTLAELQEPGVRPFRGSRVVIRQGDPFNINDLRRVAAPFAKTICILASPNAAEMSVL